MSCDTNRAAFIALVAASPTIATALGTGDADVAGHVLESVYQTAKHQAERTYQRQWRSGDMVPQARAALLAAQAGCTALFLRMSALQLKLPVHTKPKPGVPVALPRSVASQAGYAALERTLQAIEQGSPLPDVTATILEVRGVARPTSPADKLIPAQVATLVEQLRGIPVDPARPPFAGFVNAIARGMIDPAAMTEEQVQQAMTRMVLQEVCQQAILRAPRLLDLARGQVDDLDVSMRQELDRAAEEIVATADDTASRHIPPALWDEARAYQADPATAPRFAVILVTASGQARCSRCGQFQDVSGQHACPISSVVDTFPALRAQTEPMYQDREGLDQLIAPAVHAALTHTAQELRGPAVPSRLRAAAEAYLGVTAAGPSAAATRAFVQIVWAAGDTIDETEHSRTIMHQMIARRVELTPCLNLANGIHEDDPRSAIAGLRGIANGLLRTPDAPPEWRLAAAEWQYHRPYNDWSPTAEHDVEFARYLAATSGITRCPQCQQFMPAARSHTCPVGSPSSGQVTAAIIDVASGRGGFRLSFGQPSPDEQAIVELAQAITADPQTYGTPRGAAANYLLRLHELETRYGIALPGAAVESACIDLAQTVCMHAGLSHCMHCDAYVVDGDHHQCSTDGSGWRMPRVIDEAVATLDATPTLVAWLNRQRHAGLAASDALTDEELSAVLSAMTRFEDGAIDYDLSTGAYALLCAAEQVGRAGLDIPKRGGTIQERIAAMALIDLLCRRAGRQQCMQCGQWLAADGQHHCLRQRSIDPSARPPGT